MISEWRSIRPMEINQYYITMVIHCDIARDVHCEITIGNDVARYIYCDVTMNNAVAMCTYHRITMHNDVDVNLFYYVLSALYLIMILVWVVWNKTRTSWCLISLGWRTHSLFCVRLFHSSFGLMKYPYTNTTHVFSPE